MVMSIWTHYVTNARYTKWETSQLKTPRRLLSRIYRATVVRGLLAEGYSSSQADAKTRTVGGDTVQRNTLQRDTVQPTHYCPTALVPLVPHGERDLRPSILDQILWRSAGTLS